MARDGDKEPFSINRIELKGRLGGDPEIKRVGRGELLSMSIATEERWKDKKTGEWVGETQWHRVTTFVDEHIAVAERWKKGDTVYLTGILIYRSWEDDHGKKQYRTEIQLKSWHELEKRLDAPGKDGTGHTRDRDRRDSRDDDRRRDDRGRDDRGRDDRRDSRRDDRDDRRDDRRDQDRNRSARGGNDELDDGESDADDSRGHDRYRGNSNRDDLNYLDDEIPF